MSYIYVCIQVVTARGLCRCESSLCLKCCHTLTVIVPIDLRSTVDRAPQTA